METRQLLYFLEVARELHFGRAAAMLSVSQPALSQQISRLERALGVKLLNRTTRDVSLTRIGARIAAQVELLDETEKRVTSAIRDLTSGRTGDLRIGFIPSAAFGILPQLVAPFSQEHPEVHLDLNELPSEHQLRRVATGELDVGLVRDLEHSPGMTLTPLVLEQLHIACPASRWADNGEPVDLRDVRGERVIMLPRQVAPSMSLNIGGLLHDAGLPLTDVMEALAFPTTLGLVASGMGVAIVPACVLSVRMPGLVYRPIAQPGAYSQLSLVTEASNKDPLVQQFKEGAQATIQ